MNSNEFCTNRGDVDYARRGSGLIQEPEFVTPETQERDRIEDARRFKSKEPVMHLGFMMDGAGDLGPGLMEPEIEVEIHK